MQAFAGLIILAPQAVGAAQVEEHHGLRCCHTAGVKQRHLLSCCTTGSHITQHSVIISLVRVLQDDDDLHGSMGSSPFSCPVDKK